MGNAILNEFMVQKRPLKPFLSLEEQTEKILSRGCLGDRDFIIGKLQYVNYYRLSGYLYPFRKRRMSDGFVEEEFEAGTRFEQIWDLYRFDRRMRLLLLDAIERIEIGIRTSIAYHWALDCAAAKISNPQGRKSCYRKRRLNESLISLVQKQYDNSKAPCANHYKGGAWNIADVKDLPVWVFVEFTTFANLKVLCESCLKPKISRLVAANFGFQEPEKFYAVLEVLREVRNICAHHGMVWNKVWEHVETRNPLAPDLPGCLPASPSLKKRLTYILHCCDFLVSRVVPNSAWNNRVLDLVKEIPLPEKMLTRMGITSDFVGALVQRGTCTSVDVFENSDKENKK